MYIRFINTLLLLLFTFPPVKASDVDTILQKSDSIMFPKNLQGTLSMKLISKNKDIRIIKAKAYQKTVSDTREDRLFLFTFPPSVRGTGVLVHSYLDDNDDKMWIYLPAVGKIKRVALSSSGGGYFMGSDFTYSDLISRGRTEFNFKLIGEGVINSEPCNKILTEGKTETIKKKYGYSKEIRYYRKQDHVLIKIEYYDLADELLKEYIVHQVDTLGKYLFPSKITMENKQTGHSSIIEFGELKSPKEINNKYFTHRFLKNQ